MAPAGLRRRRPQPERPSMPEPFSIVRCLPKTVTQRSKKR
jgi:hypothetical protein